MAIPKMDIKPDLINTKLLPPYSSAEMVERPRLMGLFARTERQKATILVAPAGYGKTVAMAQFAAAGKKPLVWYQLDQYDNDPTVFFQYLIAGLGRHFPDFGRGILPLVAQGVAPRLLLAAFINSLEKKAKGGLTLALDDYHQITEPTVHNFLQELLQNIPGGIHIVIASRTSVPLSLSRLVMLGEAHVAGSEELRFDRREIKTFLSWRNKQLSEAALKAVEQQTAGWPVILRLIGESASGVAGSLEKHGTQKIYDYLATEVLDRQPEHVRDFLLGTSVLEELIPSFCDELLERTDSGQILDYLEKQQLFLIPLGGRRAYRYHQLFRDFLLERLGAKRKLWQRKAGMIAWTCGDLRTAVEYFGAAGAEQQMKEVLKEAGRQAFVQGHWQTVARWLEAIAEEKLAGDPWLGLHRARVEISRGRLEEAENWLNGAAPLFAVSGDQAGLAAMRLLQARVWRYRGSFQKSLELLEQVVGSNPAQESTRFDLTLEKVSCLLHIGHFHEAEAVLIAALKLAERDNDKYAVAQLLEGLGHTYFLLGNYSTSLQMYQQGAAVLPDRLLPNYYIQDCISTIYQDWGELEQALDYARRNVAIKETLGLTEALPSAYGQLASLYIDRGEWALAEEYFNRAISYCRKIGDPAFLGLNLSLLAEFLGLQGRWSEARVKAEEALSTTGHLSSIDCICQAMTSVAFIHTGNIHEGKQLLAAAINDSKRMGSQKVLCFASAFQAWLHFGAGEAAAAREYAEQALELGAKSNFLQFFLTRFAMLKQLLAWGLENGVEVTFLHRVLARKGADALPLLTELAGHAEPEVRMRTIAPLAEIGGPRAGETICRLREDTDAGVRQLARLTARRLGLAGSGQDDAETGTISLQIATLGQFRVSGIGNTDWRTVKTRDLLAYLVHQSKPVSKEKILEDLWPDIDQKRAEHIFRTTLYYLRQTLKMINSPELVHYESQQCQLRPGSFSSDRQRFQELAAAGLRECTVSEEAAALLEQAVELYRGEYMDGMDYPWLLPHKESLKYLCLEVRKQLARRYLEAQDYVRAITHLTRIEEYDCFTEEAHVMLMTAFARQGNYSAVRRQYRKLELLWKQELGLPLPPAIQDVYRSLCKTNIM